MQLKPCAIDPLDEILIASELRILGSLPGVVGRPIAGRPLPGLTVPLISSSRVAFA